MCRFRKVGCEVTYRNFTNRRGNDMSRRNGDKARFGRQRKEQIHRRERIRALRNSMAKVAQPDERPKAPAK